MLKFIQGNLSSTLYMDVMKEEIGKGYGAFDFSL